MSKTSPSSRRSQQSGSVSPIIILLVAVVMFAAGVAVTWWYLTQRVVTTTNVPTPPPDFGPLTPGTLAPTPEAVATADAALPEAAPALPAPPTAAKAGPAGAPPTRRAAKPPVAPAPQVPQLPSQAERISGVGASRSFVLGTTVVESLRAVGRDLDGFETSGIGVKRAPKVEGQIELVMQPTKVAAGQPYAVMVFLKNDGKRAIEVDEMKVSMIVDGKWSTRPLPPKARQVAPKQRVLLEELPGIWRPGVKEWAVEAVVTSKNQDVYRNRLTWR